MILNKFNDILTVSWYWHNMMLGILICLGFIMRVIYCFLKDEVLIRFKKETNGLGESLVHTTKYFYLKGRK